MHAPAAGSFLETWEAGPGPPLPTDTTWVPDLGEERAEAFCEGTLAPALLSVRAFGAGPPATCLWFQAALCRAVPGWELGGGVRSALGEPVSLSPIQDTGIASGVPWERGCPGALLGRGVTAPGPALGKRQAPPADAPHCHQALHSAPGHPSPGLARRPSAICHSVRRWS